MRGGEASGREEARRLLDVREHDRHRALGLTDRKAADDRLRGQRRRGIDGLAETLRDLSEQALGGAEAGLALRVADGLQEAGLAGQAQLAARRVFADPGLFRVIARLQLGAFESLGEGGRQTEAQAAARDDALDHRLDPPRCAARPG